MKPPVLELNAARASGASRYFTGVPCKSGHVSERITVSNTCVECNRSVQARSAKKRKEKIAAWFLAHKDEQRIKQRQRRKANPEPHRTGNRAWMQRNPEKMAAHRAAWKSSNSERIAATRHRRRAQSRKAQPVWANMSQMVLIYQKAKSESARLGVQIEVDHIVPIRSQFVCGLHNEFNLQLLPLSENRSKSNRWWPDMPDKNDGR